MTTLQDMLVLADRVPWVPQGSDRVWFKPLRINTTTGRWTNILKVTESGVVNRHRHLSEVEGYVLQGRWHYLEHDWQAEPGSFVFEPPGDVHTLVADVDGDEPMLTLFTIYGPIEYMDENGELAYVETAETKMKRYLDHCRDAGIETVDLDF
ncbi:2,4'-dihydroxyacetophenone dioxygenase family protein [Haloactinopolyspora sp.]|uniref:2,4'-dihydroxyacetophenone dioxygenase family protein n=1 Tax=Haloactinopolyspora sp. TaxID=1966353 RepID=UPI0026167343|nr:2,4'-dihydroxyacetophenone dioxygenase family protein [Haloactinopolyspora sp.]